MNDFITLWATFGTWFYNLLPNSPFVQFKGYIGEIIQPYLKWLNWFFPVDLMLTTMLVWLSAISAFYLVQAIGRWLRALGD